MAVRSAQTKRCCRCGRRKALAAFPFRSRRARARQRHCKACHAARMRTLYAADPANAAARGGGRAQLARARARARVWAYLHAHPCVDCGERDPVVLEFDHVRGTKHFTIARAVSLGFAWRRIEREIAKCDVRCANDHRRRTAVQLRWHSAR